MARQRIAHPDAVDLPEAADAVGQNNRDQDGNRSADLDHVVLELGDPRAAPGLGVFGFPQQNAAFGTHGRAHGLNEVRPPDPLGHGLDVVVDKKGFQLGFEVLLQHLALGLHGTLFGLAFHIFQGGLQIIDDLVFFQVLEPVLFGQSSLKPPRGSFRAPRPVCGPLPAPAPAVSSSSLRCLLRSSSSCSLKVLMETSFSSRAPCSSLS